MSKVITDLPDEIDPVVLIEKSKVSCPFCKTSLTEWYRGKIKYKYADKKGKHHNILTYKNKYEWKRIPKVYCTKCKCEFDTGWYPVDHKMFEIPVKEENEININYDIYLP